MAKFESLESLQEWLNDTGVKLSDLEITVATEVCNESCSMEQEKPENIVELSESMFTVKSLVNQPSVALYENSKFTENTWFVDDYEFIPGACGTNKITFNDSTLYINICENDGNAYADLICEVDGEFKTVTFKLEKGCDHKASHDMILSA